MSHDTRRETRILSAEEATAFLQNMRWFADMGRIVAKRVDKRKDRWAVTANRGTWSFWVPERP